MNYTKIATDMASNAERLSVYNKYAAKKVKRFPDTKTAIRRTAQVLESCNVKLKDITTSKPANNDKPKVVKKKVAPKKTVAKKEGNLPGPKSEFVGKKLYKLVKENPRRKGSIGYKSFEVIRNGMKYETFIELKGINKDLRYDVNHGHVEVR